MTSSEEGAQLSYDASSSLPRNSKEQDFQPVPQIGSPVKCPVFIHGIETSSNCP